MLCQNCNKREANVHFTQIINNNKVEMYLCEECAREKGQVSFGSPISVSDFFSGLLGFAGPSAYITPVVQQAVCNKCGMTYEEFQKSGKLGCDNCYEIFADRLQPLIKRLHGNVEHSGKCPLKECNNIKASKEIEDLRRLLDEAVKNEEYEKAAQLRDKIKALEAGNN